MAPAPRPEAESDADVAPRAQDPSGVPPAPGELDPPPPGPVPVPPSSAAEQLADGSPREATSPDDTLRALQGASMVAPVPGPLGQPDFDNQERLSEAEAQIDRVTAVAATTGAASAGATTHQPTVRDDDDESYTPNWGVYAAPGVDSLFDPHATCTGRHDAAARGGRFDAAARVAPRERTARHCAGPLPPEPRRTCDGPAYATRAGRPTIAAHYAPGG